MKTSHIGHFRCLAFTAALSNFKFDGLFFFVLTQAACCTLSRICLAGIRKFSRHCSASPW